MEKDKKHLTAVKKHKTKNVSLRIVKKNVTKADIVLLKIEILHVIIKINPYYPVYLYNFKEELT